MSAQGAVLEEVRGELTVRRNPDSQHDMRVTCTILSNKFMIFKTKDKKALLARIPLGELQVTIWPHRKDLFCLASSCDAGDYIVCCADSEDIRSEWLAVFQEQGIDVATELGADDEAYVNSWLAGIEVNGDALKGRLVSKMRRLDEQQARAGLAS